MYLQHRFVAAAAALLEVVAGVVQILKHTCQLAEVGIINGCVEDENQGFVSFEAVNGFRANVAVDVEYGVDGVDFVRREAGRHDVDVDYRSPQVFVDHVADLGRNAEEACSGSV